MLDLEVVGADFPVLIGTLIMTIRALASVRRSKQLEDDKKTKKRKTSKLPSSPLVRSYQAEIHDVLVDLLNTK